MKSLMMLEAERVEVATAFKSEHLRPGRKILDGETRFLMSEGETRTSFK
jgi:hypothetical protein